MSNTPEAPVFESYEVAGIGTVIAHDGPHYIVRLLDGRVCGYRSHSGTPNPEAAAADIANPAPEPLPVPSAVTRRQLFLWLNANGVTRAMLRASLASSEASLIELEEAVAFDRTHPLVIRLASDLAIDADTAFRQAGVL